MLNVYFMTRVRRCLAQIITNYHRCHRSSRRTPNVILLSKIRMTLTRGCSSSKTLSSLLHFYILNINSNLLIELYKLFLMFTTEELFSIAKMDHSSYNCSLWVRFPGEESCAFVIKYSKNFHQQFDYFHRMIKYVLVPRKSSYIVNLR